MADYYTHFSLVFTLPSQEAQTYALQLAEQASCIQQGDEPPEDFPEALVGVIEDWCFEAAADTAEGKPALWLLRHRCGSASNQRRMRATTWSTGVL